MAEASGVTQTPFPIFYGETETLTLPTSAVKTNPLPIYSGETDPSARRPRHNPNPLSRETRQNQGGELPTFPLGRPYLLYYPPNLSCLFFTYIPIFKLRKGTQAPTLPVGDYFSCKPSPDFFWIKTEPCLLCLPSKDKNLLIYLRRNRTFGRNLRRNPKT